MHVDSLVAKMIFFMMITTGAIAVVNDEQKVNRNSSEQVLFKQKGQLKGFLNSLNIHHPLVNDNHRASKHMIRKLRRNQKLISPSNDHSAYGDASSEEVSDDRGEVAESLDPEVDDQFLSDPTTIGPKDNTVSDAQTIGPLDTTVPAATTIGPTDTLVPVTTTIEPPDSIVSPISSTSEPVSNLVTEAPEDYETTSNVTDIMTANFTNQTASIGDELWNNDVGEIDGDMYGGRLGYSLALSSDGLILGAAYMEPSYISNTDAKSFVRSYYRESKDDLQWKEFSGADIDAGTSPYDWVGPNIAISGNGMVLAVGGRPGSPVATYHRTLDSQYAWEFLANTAGVSDGTNSLATVALNYDGTVLAVGGTRFRVRGLVRIYERSDSSSDVWLSSTDIDGHIANYENARGGALSLDGSGNTIAIGDPVLRTDDGRLIETTGIVRLLDRSEDNEWTLRLSIDGQANDEFLGSSVALSSDGLTVLIGAASNPPAKGSVLTYTRNCFYCRWTKLPGDHIFGLHSGSRFGHSLAVSSDGTRFVSGAIYGGRGGQVATFQRNANLLPLSSWEQLGSFIQAERYADDFGTDVAISGDGTIVVASAPMNNAACDDDGGCETVNTGHIRTFLLEL